MAKCNPIDPSIIDSGVASFEQYMRKTISSIECCMPGMILEFNRKTHIALVQPLCNHTTNIGESIERKPIRIHVWRYACGGKIIDLPMKKGDTGWIIASDYDTFTQKRYNSNFNPSENKGPYDPNTSESHSYIHGFFLPDCFCEFDKISGDDLIIGEYDDEGNIYPWESGGGGGNLMFEYDSSTKTVNDGIAIVARKTYFVSARNISEAQFGEVVFTGTGYVFVHVYHANGAAVTASIKTLNADEDSTPNPSTFSSNSHTDILLYRMKDWTIQKDYRFATTVPIYE